MPKQSPKNNLIYSDNVFSSEWQVYQLDRKNPYRYFDESSKVTYQDYLNLKGDTKEEIKKNKEEKDADTYLVSPRKEIEYSNFRFINIDKLGFEVEGAWLKGKQNLVSDASFSKEDFSPRYASVGEYVSKPIDNFNTFLNELALNWPDTYNSKCGLHVHFSLKSVALYALCMDIKFYHSFLAEMERWGHQNKLVHSHLFWERLAGANKYCKKVFIPDEQAAYINKGLNRQNRRTQLHYCYGQTETIECRLFPMFEDVNLAISAVICLVNFVEKYLENKTLSPLAVTGKVVDNFNYEPITLETLNLGIDEKKEIIVNNKFNYFNLKNRISKNKKKRI